MLRSAGAVLLVIFFAVTVKYYADDENGGLLKVGKDGTAQGVANVRHYEAMQDPSTRLYYDPYAKDMYLGGSFVESWLGESGTKTLFEAFTTGLIELITTRTKWLDDKITESIRNRNAEQMVIMGAGYDTRGFRLDFPANFRVFEVDQPEVQSLKKKKLNILAREDATVASRMRTRSAAERNSGNNDDGVSVEFVGVDFNTDSVGEILTQTDNSFDGDKITIFVLEGVTQYIPKPSTADTLSQVRKVVPPGSVLLMSYVPQGVYDDPAKYCGSDPKKIERTIRWSGWYGEPWISGWTEKDLRSFLSGLGYEVVSDTTFYELNEKYLKPLGRNLKKDDALAVERYVMAIVT